MNKKFLKTSFYTISFFTSLSAWSTDMDEEKKPTIHPNHLIQLPHTSIGYASNALSRSELTCNKEEEKTCAPQYHNNDNVNDEKIKYSKEELIKYIQFLEEEVDKNREREYRYKISLEELQDENKFLKKRHERIEIINERLQKTNNLLNFQLQNTDAPKPSGH